MKSKLAAVIFSAAIGSSACTSERIVYRPMPLPLPPRPTLPAVEPGALSCLPDPAYRRLVRRELTLRHYCERLETIIQATRKSTPTQER